MSELLIASPLVAALVAYLVPCVASALIALIAWQTFRRLGEGLLRDLAWAFGVTAAIQAVLLLAGSTQALPSPVLRLLDCGSLAVMGWAFFGSWRRTFLVGSLAACGIYGAFALSLWQLSGVESGWANRAWHLIGSVILGSAALTLWRRRSEYPALLFTSFTLLTVGYALGMLGWEEGTLLARLIAFPLIMAALVQFSTREIESIRTELVSFSQHSLRQTQQLLTLLRASTALIGRSDVAAILGEAVEGIALGVGADAAFAALVDDPDGRRLRLLAFYPPKVSVRGRVIPLAAQPALADAMQRGQQVVLTPSQRGIHALAALMSSTPGPAIIQPLTGKGRALGLIAAMNGRHGRAFTEDERRVMEAFGAQVGTAVENALLDQVIESQTRELAELLVAREEEAGRRAAILESLAEGVIVFDHNEQAILSNPAASAVLELEPAGLIGKPLQAIMNGQIHPDDYELVQSLLEGAARSACRIRWADKTVLLSVAPVRLSSTGRHGTVMVLRDITEDAKVERLKSEFVSVVSHELRSPFATLDSAVQIIQRYGLDHLLPPQREQWRQLEDGLKHAETLINNLVTFASFLSKQGQLRVTALDVRELAEEVLESLGPVAQTRHVTMASELAEDVPLVHGDRERLAEAIYHLVHNAIKFNRPGGMVIVSCRSAPESVIVEVADTGMGIPPDRLQEVWRDFAQLADPLRRGVEGLGLGLPLVRYVIQAHGGEVWADSQVGQGSVFGFSLPLPGPK